MISVAALRERRNSI